MRNMQYRVMVTDTAGHDFEKTFIHPAPEWLFDERVDNTPTYLKMLSDTFHGAILRETPWRCLGCNRKATYLLPRPFCFVQQGAIANRLVPVCQSEECKHIATVHLNEMEEYLDKKVQSEIGVSSATSMRRIDPQPCGNCGIVGLVKACKRCKQIAYCGKECQKMDWKRHKPECKPATAVQNNTDHAATSAAHVTLL